VVSDKKIPNFTGSSLNYFNPDIKAYNDYYPYGMLVPERHGNTGDYRYGFNGKENDNEVKGEGLQVDYGFRVYDPRIGKFLSTDPLKANFPWYTPYQFAGNKPIWALDLDGLEELIFQDSFKPYVKGINQVITANEELIKEYNNIQKEEKNNIKIFFSARNMMGEKHQDAQGITVDYTAIIHNYKKFTDYFAKSGNTSSDLSEDNMPAWNQANSTAKLIGVENATDLSFDNEYFSVVFNTRFTLPAEVGQNLKRQEWDGLLATNTSTLFHEVIGHVINQLESFYQEHDNLYGFTKFSDYYTMEELDSFQDLERMMSPLDSRAHPESLMGRIITEINKSIESLKKQETETKPIENEQDEPKKKSGG